VYHVHREGTSAATHGLFASAGFELVLDVSTDSKPELVTAAVNLARFLGDYFVQSGRRLASGETVEWASSLLVARQEGSGPRFTFDEMSFDGETILRGVSQCARIWADQSDTCKAFGSPFLPAKYAQKVVHSPEALATGGRIEGIRYPAPAHMSGWWIFDQAYDGDPADAAQLMQITPVFRVLASQPRLASLFGLDAGYAFSISTDPASPANESRKVWFEDDVARQGVP
jgi:hypothetical protein